MPMSEGLERAEWNVFHGAVQDALPLLAEISEVERGKRAFHEWLTGVALGACGRYGEAFDHVQAISPGTPEFSMACSLKASLLRQLGCHDLAVVADRQAMASAATPGSAIEALTGLAADSVGMEDAATAANTLAQARSLLQRVAADPAALPIWWRHRVRLTWVECEVALLQSDYDVAVARASEALEAAEAANAPRHVAKSLLFLAVSQVEAGQRESAVANLQRSLTLSTSMGFLVVAWPGYAVLAALVQPDDPEAARNHFAKASAIADEIRAGLSGDLAERWDARADIAALHRAAKG
jgi:tetratricopeptide (TPR) repeat protein